MFKFWIYPQPLSRNKLMQILLENNQINKQKRSKKGQKRLANFMEFNGQPGQWANFLL